jgi:Spore coat polysaccharide biosynthesis protein F, CMP-KDO synthetase homolog
MKALSVLFGGRLTGEIFEPVFNGKNSVCMALEQAKKFPSAEKTVLLAPQGNFPFPDGVQIEQKNWTKKSLLEKIAELQAGYDCVYFAFADCPFLDPALAGALSQRHIQERADYSYADGFPYGLAPEILSPGTAGILAKILGDDDGHVERDMLFSVIQKDINAFDIEAEISAVDLRCHRINLCADSKRNLLLLKNFIAAFGNIPAAADVEKIVQERPEILRTLPAFFPIQVYGGCPQACKICPYPLFTDAAGRKDFMDTARFASLLDTIVSFSGDAVIDLSLWGELSLHPEKIKLIEEVISRNALSLVIETSGIGWKEQELENCARLCSDLSQKAERKNKLPPLSWIVSLDSTDPQRYMELRGQGFAEAENCAKKLLSLFPKDCYVQAVRVKGQEEDTEKFYRRWKDSNVIIQKYDDFCGALEKKQASDISPVIRKPCWHTMRDMPVLIDGTVPVCREDLSALKQQSKRILGNVFKDSLENIWKEGDTYYREQCSKNYSGLCKDCDEYYTFNF